ncbi:MAG: hypothetical protein WCV90_02720 [Candidatus Woesearchaeota archaeon]
MGVIDFILNTPFNVTYTRGDRVIKVSGSINSLVEMAMEKAEDFAETSVEKARDFADGILGIRYEISPAFGSPVELKEFPNGGLAGYLKSNPLEDHGSKIASWLHPSFLLWSCHDFPHTKLRVFSFAYPIDAVAYDEEGKETNVSYRGRHIEYGIKLKWPIKLDLSGSNGSESMMTSSDPRPADMFGHGNPDYGKSFWYRHKTVNPKKE